MIEGRKKLEKTPISLSDLVQEAVKGVRINRRINGQKIVGIVFQGENEGLVREASEKISELFLEVEELFPWYENLSLNGNDRGRSYFQDQIKRYPGRCFLIYDPNRVLTHADEYSYRIDLDKISVW